MIRQLKPGEAIPSGEPRRYRSQHGYWRMRWKVGKGEYVEVYEHRVMDGRVTTAEQVHHVNEDKGDNRPENLMPVVGREHMHHHRKFTPEQEAQVVLEYLAGATGPELAERWGCANSLIYGTLRRQGVKSRSSYLPEYQRARLRNRYAA